MAQLGVDYLVVLPFTKALAALSAQAFMQRILCDRLSVMTLFTGYDNRFGHNRKEGFDDYVRYGQEMGMQVLRGDAELMADGSQAISSSVIRTLLVEKGQVELMPQYLTFCDPDTIGGEGTGRVDASVSDSPLYVAGACDARRTYRPSVGLSDGQSGA